MEDVYNHGYMLYVCTALVLLSRRRAGESRQFAASVSNDLFARCPLLSHGGRRATTFSTRHYSRVLHALLFGPLFYTQKSEKKSPLTAERGKHL